MKKSVKKTIILILSTLLFLTSCVTNQEKIASNNSTVYGEIIKDKDNQEIITILIENNLENIFQETVGFFDDTIQKENDIQQD